jgi:hypothetical protein
MEIPTFIFHISKEIKSVRVIHCLALIESSLGDDACQGSAMIKQLFAIE